MGSDEKAITLAFSIHLAEEPLDPGSGELRTTGSSASPRSRGCSLLTSCREPERSRGRIHPKIIDWPPTCQKNPNVPDDREVSRPACHRDHHLSLGNTADRPVHDNRRLGGVSIRGPTFWPHFWVQIRLKGPHPGCGDPFLRLAWAPVRGRGANSGGLLPANVSFVPRPRFRWNRNGLISPRFHTRVSCLQPLSQGLLHVASRPYANSDASISPPSAPPARFPWGGRARARVRATPSGAAASVCSTTPFPCAARHSHARETRASTAPSPRLPPAGPCTRASVPLTRKPRQFAMIQGGFVVAAIVYYGLRPLLANILGLAPRHSSATIPVIAFCAGSTSVTAGLPEYGRLSLRSISGGFSPMSEKIPYAPGCSKHVGPRASSPGPDSRAGARMAGR